MIAFTLAFVFRGFVIEAFQIPTGSMAPTLLGAHMRFNDADSGYTWQVGPHQYIDRNTQQVPAPRQGTAGRPVVVTDPMSGVKRTSRNERLLGGDHIFVMKGLYPLLPESLGGPSRFDVIVFKDPTGPQTNFIKRLVGMPGEQLALVDGDVFARPAPDGQTAPWDDEAWQIQRKPDRVQREVWQPVFDSFYTPSGPSFRTPWLAGGEGWDTSGRVYTKASGTGPGELRWDTARRPLDDSYAYNETPGTARLPTYPVSDIALSFGLELEEALGDNGRIAADFEVRGQVFRVVLMENEVLFQRKIAAEQDWETVSNTSSLPRRIAPSGKPIHVEVWHVDQRLAVYLDGEAVAQTFYDMSPALRAETATGWNLDELLERERAIEASGGTPTPELGDPGRYRRPEVRWVFETNAGLRLHRVAIARDIHYQPGVYGRPGPSNHSRARSPHASTHPTRNTVVLDGDQFFFCGDNSPASSDSRAWDRPDDWVSATVDPTIGVVHRDLIIGKAFFVYLPATHQLFGQNVLFDFGRLRFIK